MQNTQKDTIINSVSEPIKVQIIDNGDKVDWNIWFLTIAVLSLIAAVIIPFAQKKYEESKANIGFHLYVKKKLGIVWFLLNGRKYEYKKQTEIESIEKLSLTFDRLIRQFEKDYQQNKNTIYPLSAFVILFNLQNLIFIVKEIQFALNEIDINNLNDKTLEFGDKLSNKEHHKLNGVFLLIEHYLSITIFNDKFDSLQSMKRDIQDSTWIGIKVDNSILNNQELVLEDLKYIRENESSLFEILNINQLLIQELKSYSEYK